MTGKKEYGIAVFHNIGDVLCCTPVAKQLKVDDPDCHVTWFTSEAGEVAVRNNPFIDELIVVPGNQYQLDAELPALARLRPWTRFFTPAAYLNYHAIPGGSIATPKGTIFGLVKAAAQLNWTVPLIFPFRLSKEEQAEAKKYWAGLPQGLKILVETDYRSEQSPWTDDWNFDMLEALRELEPVFVFTSKDRPKFLDAFLRRYPKADWCHLPFRLNAELFNLCDAFVGVSSGLSCLTYSDYCRTDVPRIEVTRGEHWGAAELGHHRELFLCYTREKYLESLESLRCKLASIPTQPIFSARHPVEVRFKNTCPSCSSENSSVAAAEDLRQCTICSAVYSVAKDFTPREQLFVELIGERCTYESAQDFLQSPVREASADSAFIYGELGSTPWPRELLEKVQFALRPGGELTLSAPNVQGVLAASAGSGWSFLRPKETLWYFTPRYLREVLIQAGFVVDECATLSDGKNRDAFLDAIANARPDLKSAELETFAAEVNRRGGGDVTYIRAKKRGGFKGRVVAQVAESRRTLTLSPTDAFAVQVAEQARVSVIIPCYNHYRYLTECVRSVLAQTYRNWELILVNDGSTDGSGELVETLAAEYQTAGVRAVHIKHSGLEEARDIGAALAEGEWLLPLDSDDRLLPHFIESSLAALSQTPDAQIIYGAGEQFGFGEKLFDPGAFEPAAVLAGRYYPSTVLVKKPFWLRTGGYNSGSPFHLSEHHIWLAAVESEAKVAYLPDPLYQFRVERSGQIHHETNPHFRVARALIRTLHSSLFSRAELEREHKLIASHGGLLFDAVSKMSAAFPGLWAPYLWRALICDENGLFDQAVIDYDAARKRQQTRDWQTECRLANRQVPAAGTSF